MKAILVLDEMPINCGECILEVRKMCTGRRKDIDVDLEKKPSWCPIKEIPDDAEELEEYTKRIIKENLEGIWNSIKEAQK